MNIVFFTSSYPTKSQLSWGPFIKECALSVADAKHVIYVLVFSPENKYSEYQQAENIKVITYPYLPFAKGSLHIAAGLIPSIKKSFLAKIQLIPYCIASFYFLVKIVKKYNIDIIHAHWFLPAGFLGALSKIVLRKPLIVTGLGAEFYLQNNFLTGAALGYTSKKADKKVFVSNYLKNRALKYKVNEKNVTVIPNVVRTDVFSPAAEKTTSNKVVIGLAKRLVPEKNIEDLLYAISKIKPQFLEHITVKIIGDGSEKDKLMALAIELKLKDRVLFLGDKPHEGIPDLLRTFDIYVDPSTQEGIATSNLEAMSSGLAVIVAKGFGNEDAINNKHNGLLYEPRNIDELTTCITQLIEDPKERKRLGENARKTIKEKFSSEISGNKYKKIYDDLQESMNK
jgi:glycosyltransferase involved in cell wall biosynthesis